MVPRWVPYISVRARDDRLKSGDYGVEGTSRGGRSFTSSAWGLRHCRPDLRVGSRVGPLLGVSINQVLGVRITRGHKRSALD